MKSVVLLVLGLHLAAADIHSMRYILTGVSGDTDFPEYTSVGQLDNSEFVYFDSNIKRMIPKTEWIKREGADYWDRESQREIGWIQFMKVDLQTLRQRFNQSQSTGVHTYQFMYGCEWDDETGDTDGFDQYGYDGEDLISLDLKNMRYITPVQQAVISTQKWNNDRALLEYNKNYLTNDCVDWLKKYLQYGRSSLERKVSPEVSLLQKEPSSPVTCHATGFYPRGVVVTWQKDGQEMHEDVELGETVPNQDGTFQSSIKLTVKAEEWKKNPKSYTCVVQHKSEENDTILQLDPTVFKTNSGNSEKPGIPWAIIIGCVVVVLAVLAAVIGFIAWKKSKSGYGRTNASDTDSDNSEKPAVMA